MYPSNEIGLRQVFLISVKRQIRLQMLTYSKLTIDTLKKRDFMDPISVKECMQSLKIKNLEGYDRIPKRVLVDGVEQFVGAFSGLFQRIYTQLKIPDQWLI